MTGDDAVDPDVTPAYGIVSGTGPNGLLRTGGLWLVVVGIVVGLIVLTLVISLA